MDHLLVQKKSTGSLRRKRSDSELAEQSSITPSDQKSREAKSALYQDTRYETLIATKGTFIGKGPLGINEACRSMYRKLLESHQSVPENTMFRDDLFDETCEAFRNKNEARVIRDISLLIVLSTESVEYGAAALDMADRQNAHSMTLAVRAVVELFRLVKREKELDREILAFSISHDHESVRIYGHYPVIKEKKTTFYRYLIRKFNFTELEGKDKWTAYKFTKSIYWIWMPSHFKRLCSVIDALPTGVNFELSQSELQFSEQTRLSQDLANQDLSASNTDLASLARDDDSQLQSLDPSGTPDTSFTKDSDAITTGCKTAPDQATPPADSSVRASANKVMPPEILDTPSATSQGQNLQDEPVVTPAIPASPFAARAGKTATIKTMGFLDLIPKTATIICEAVKCEIDGAAKRGKRKSSRRTMYNALRCLAKIRKAAATRKAKKSKASANIASNPYCNPGVGSAYDFGPFPACGGSQEADVSFNTGNDTFNPFTCNPIPATFHPQHLYQQQLYQQHLYQQYLDPTGPFDDPFNPGCYTAFEGFQALQSTEYDQDLGGRPIPATHDYGYCMSTDMDMTIQDPSVESFSRESSSDMKLSKSVGIEMSALDTSQIFTIFYQLRNPFFVPWVHLPFIILHVDTAVCYAKTNPAAVFFLDFIPLAGLVNGILNAPCGNAVDWRTLELRQTRALTSRRRTDLG
ncbi:hypothetical protein DV736_g777, partial [Chaetothyriales sp. CBS 134916]